MKICFKGLIPFCLDQDFSLLLKRQGHNGRPNKQQLEAKKKWHRTIQGELHG